MLMKMRHQATVMRKSLNGSRHRFKGLAVDTARKMEALLGSSPPSPLSAAQYHLVSYSSFMLNTHALYSLPHNLDF